MTYLRKKWSLLGFLLAASVISCGADEGEADCTIHEDPTFQLGTGESDFAPLSDGADLEMSRGAQGGCHFTLAFLTDGFAGEETLVDYRMDNLVDGDRIIVSQQFVRLRAADDGLCQTTNFVALLVAPWNVEDDRVRIEVRLEDEAGTDTQSVEVVARWPEPVAGIERDRLCGER
jgi:hypothetical protein